MGCSSIRRITTRFGFSIPGEIIEIVNFSATVISITPKPDFQPLAAAIGDAEAGRPPVGDVSQRAPGYPGLPLAMPCARAIRIAGPAVIEEAASVTILNPGQSLTVDPYGNLLLATQS